MSISSLSCSCNNHIDAVVALDLFAVKERHLSLDCRDTVDHNGMALIQVHVQTGHDELS